MYIIIIEKGQAFRFTEGEKLYFIGGGIGVIEEINHGTRVNIIVKWIKHKIFQKGKIQIKHPETLKNTLKVKGINYSKTKPLFRGGGK